MFSETATNISFVVTTPHSYFALSQLLGKIALKCDGSMICLAGNSGTYIIGTA